MKLPKWWILSNKSQKSTLHISRNHSYPMNYKKSLAPTITILEDFFWKVSIDFRQWQIFCGSINNFGRKKVRCVFNQWSILYFILDLKIRRKGGGVKKKRWTSFMDVPAVRLYGVYQNRTLEKFIVNLLVVNRKISLNTGNSLKY